MKLFGSFGTGWRHFEITYPVFFAPKAFAVTPSNLIHRIYPTVSLVCSVRRKWFTYQCPLGLRLFRNTGPIVNQYFQAASPRSNPWECLTCLAANLSTCTPQPCRKQFASSKIARTSSPLAAPPFFIPAFSASSSIFAALDAAADRYVTASVGFGEQPQPCLMNKTPGSHQLSKANSSALMIVTCEVIWAA
jgi:hypothetical protein